MSTSGRIYLDHAATTPVLPEVADTMRTCQMEVFGNPSSLHSFGQQAKHTLDGARDSIARIIGADCSEMYFTSGGTESDNFALIGVARACRNKGNHIITSVIEHHAVLETCHYLQGEGFEVTYLPVDRYGLVDPSDVEHAITDQTILVSIMHANNEIGTIQPITEISRITGAKGIPLHTDAVQTIGHIPVSVNDLGVDLLTLTAHKFYGPKGTGALYVRRGTRIARLIQGGSQERERRAGTENVAGVVGMAKALEMSVDGLDERARTETDLRNYFTRRLFQSIEGLTLNGHPTERLPNNINITIDNAEGESTLLMLDMEGIAASSGSACTSGALEPSHVLRATGCPLHLAQTAIRFSLGRSTTKEDLDRTSDTLSQITSRLRTISAR